MPIIKSAKKRVKTANKAAVRNSKTKRTLKAALKSFHAAVTGKAKDAGEMHNKAQSAIDKTAKKGLVHKNKAARLKSQASAKAKAAGVKPATKAKTAAPAKKSVAAKKVVTKKPVVKKAPAKKTVPKKK